MRSKPTAPGRSTAARSAAAPAPRPASAGSRRCVKRPGVERAHARPLPAEPDAGCARHGDGLRRRRRRRARPAGLVAPGHAARQDLHAVEMNGLNGLNGLNGRRETCDEELELVAADGRRRPAGACGDSGDDAAQQAALVEQTGGRSSATTPSATRQWSDTLRMHEVVRSAVDPLTALSVGLKVDAEALPPAVVDGIRNGSIDLKSPATTVALLARRRGRPEGPGRDRRRPGHADAPGHHLRAVPFHRR